MKSIYRNILLVAALFVTATAFGQSVHDIRINEMMIKNVDNYADEYGRKVPWIELFNTAYNTVNITGCYLTDDTTGLAAAGKKGGTVPPQWYKIPVDQQMYMPQRSYLVFFLDNSPLYGPFHTNFSTAESKSNYVALISSDAKELLELVEYPVELRDSSRVFGYIVDGLRDKDAFKKGKPRPDGELGYLNDFTPASSNVTNPGISKQEKLKRDDPYGIGMALISMAVVFTALIMIYIMLKIFNYATRRATQKSKAQEEPAAPAAAVKSADDDDDTINAEVIAAIGTALHLHFGSMHDEESEVITINMPSKRYSPWAQKELTMKKNPARK